MSIIDAIPLVVILFVLGLTAMIGLNIMNSLAAADTGGFFVSAGTNWTERGQQAFGSFNLMWGFIALGVGVSMIVGAFLVQAHPIFYVFSIIIMVIIVMISPIFANTFHAVAISTPSMTTAANQLDMIYIVTTNIPIILAIICFIMIIVLYAKFR